MAVFNELREAEVQSNLKFFREEYDRYRIFLLKLLDAIDRRDVSMIDVKENCLLVVHGDKHKL